MEKKIDLTKLLDRDGDATTRALVNSVRRYLTPSHLFTIVSLEHFEALMEGGVENFFAFTANKLARDVNDVSGGNLYDLFGYLAIQNKKILFVVWHAHFFTHDHSEKYVLKENKMYKEALRTYFEISY